MFKFLFLLLLFVYQQGLGQESEDQLQKKITKIQKKLLVLKQQLNKAYGQEHEFIQQLEQQDKLINNVSLKIIASEEVLEVLQSQLKTVDNTIEKKTQSIEKQKIEIVDLLKLQIYLNHNKTLKMLLMQTNNENTTQTKHQIKYLQNKLLITIKGVSHDINKLEALKIENLELKTQQKQKQQVLVGQKDELLDNRKLRLTILNALKREISKHQTESQSLDNDQKRLNELLLEIKNLLSDLPDDLGSHLSFAKLKGKLFKPVNGKYIRSFRSRRSEDTKWNGVVIKAGFGDKIKAIAYGRVAYADWLRGYGMLVIIDHQEGYMSLYGFNESINVEVGDWVNPQAAIATIGNSGSLATPALYFEVRKDAKPLNPKSWVR